jgi:hypothetical protein
LNTRATILAVAPTSLTCEQTVSVGQIFILYELCWLTWILCYILYLQLSEVFLITTRKVAGVVGKAFWGVSVLKVRLLECDTCKFHREIQLLVLFFILQLSILLYVLKALMLLLDTETPSGFDPSPYPVQSESFMHRATLFLLKPLMLSSTSISLRIVVMWRNQCMTIIL